jgi:hypothetical protein
MNSKINQIMYKNFILRASHTKGFAPLAPHKELPFLDQADISLTVLNYED